jgi:hypothetical protein
LYMQMTQRDQQAAGVNRGLGALFSAMAKPVNKQAMLGAFGGGEENTGAMFNNLMQLQSYQAQQQRYADLINNSDSYAKSFNVDPGMFKAMIVAAGPQGAGDVLGKVAEAQMGLTGTQTDKEYKQVMRTWGQTPDQQDAQGNPLPRPSEATWEQQQRDIATKNKAQTSDLVADKANFQPALQAYDQKIALIDQLNTPEMQAGLKEFLGQMNQYRPNLGLLDTQGRAAKALYDQVMAGQFSAGVQDFKGAGRITQQELNQDAPSQSTMGKLNQDPSTFLAGMNAYRDQLANHRANLFGKAQYIDDPRLSDQDYAKYVSQNYKPGGDLGPKTTSRNDFSRMNDSDADAAYAQLPSGASFIGPDNQVHVKK